MKYLIFLFSIVLFSLSISAQTVLTADYSVWAFQQDSPVYVFANKAYLRADSSARSKIIDSFAAGSKLIFERATNKYETIRGIYAPWVKVKYGKQAGYIWEGALAISATANRDANFVCGIENVIRYNREEEADSMTVMLKALHGGEIADAVKWKVLTDGAASFVEMKLLGNVKLLNLSDVVRVSFGGEACGVPMNYYYYGWTGTKLLVLPTKYSVGDGDSFYHIETLLFPNEYGGQPGKIIKIIEEDELIEEATETKKERRTHSRAKETYIWDGQKAIKKSK